MNCVYTCIKDIEFSHTYKLCEKYTMYIIKNSFYDDFFFVYDMLENYICSIPKVEFNEYFDNTIELRRNKIKKLLFKNGSC